jgi:outer membrane lipoprotein-sorting protein
MTKTAKWIDCVVVSALLLSTLLPTALRAGGPTLDEVLANHCRARETTATLKARFDQTKVFTLFEEEEKSKGVVYFAQPGRICWQYSQPDQSSTVINEQAGWSVFPDIKQVQKFNLAGSQTNKVLSIVGFGPCGSPLTESFDIAMSKGKKGAFVLEMKPTDEGITPYFSRVVLTLDKSDYLPRKIELHERSGDILMFGFSDLDRNIKLNNAIFEYAVPDGYEVVEY